MGLFDNPIGAISDGISSVSNGVNHAITTTTEAIAGSDVGKVAGAVATPFTALRDAHDNVIRGNFGGAANNVVGGFMNTNPISMGINSSSSLRDAMYSDEGNNLTGGWSRDAVRAQNATNRLQNGEALTDSEYSDIVRYSVRSAAYGTAVAATVNSGLGSTIYDKAAANPMSSFLAAKTLASGNGAAAADKFLGTGGIIDSLVNGPRTPASSSASGIPGAYDSSTFIAGINWPVILGGTMAILVFILFKRKRK